jgi:poly-gamma-glutamate capsule biosynthesis protein CapA/YwtB (metallophosphatase superfamily)
MKLLCLGDVAIGEEVPSERKWSPPGDFKPGNDEKIVFNWELPIGEQVNSNPRTSGPRLLVAPKKSQILEKWAPGFVTLATNHMLDANSDGLGKTIEELESIGFKTVGAGFSSESISEPLFWVTEEGRLSIINWVFPETNPEWMTVPGVNCWPGLKEAEAIIRDLKTKSNWLMLILHWSNELFGFPRPEDREIARSLAGLGVDIIIGHHPHVVRGFEMIGVCPVFYSLGNFFFSDFKDTDGQWIQEAPLNRQSLGIAVTFKKGAPLQYETISFIQKQKEVIQDLQRHSELRFKRISKPIQTSNPNDYLVWYEKRKSFFMNWEAKWHFGLRKLGVIGTFKYLVKRLRNS